MSIQRALRAATARAALSRFDVAAQTADVVSTFEQETNAKENTSTAAKDAEDIDTDDEAVEETTTVYCDACNKARILSTNEAELADVSADNWTCANVSFQFRFAFAKLLCYGSLTGLCLDAFRVAACEDPAKWRL